MRDSSIFAMLNNERKERIEDKQQIFFYLGIMAKQISAWEEMIESIPILGKVIIKKYREKVEKDLKKIRR